MIAMRCLKISTPLTLIFSLLTTPLVFANALPHGCESSGYGFQDPYVTFNDTGAQTFFLMQNEANAPIFLERVTQEEAFMNPRLQSKLNPSQWAAFASDTSNTHFKCSVPGDEAPRQVNCSEALKICQYPRVKFALSNMGSYWVATNKTLEQVIKEATTKGIYLKW